MLPTRLAAVSQESMDASSASKMSFQRMITRDAIAFVLHRLQVDELPLDVSAPLQVGERARQVLAGGHEDGALVQSRFRGRLHAVELEQVARLVDVVDDVVDCGGKRVDVLAVERRHILRVEELDDVVRDLVAGMLDSLQVSLGDRSVGVLPEADLRLPGCFQGVLPRAREEVVELRWPGDER